MAEVGFDRTSEDEERLEEITARSDSLIPINKYNWDMMDKLEHAVRNGDTSKVSELIEAGVNPTYGLFDAVQNNDESMVRLLMDAGADVNATSSEMFYAVRKYDESMVQCLIDAGADVNISSYDGRTTFVFPIQDNYEAKLKFLIDAGADFDTTSYYGKTALFLAIQNKNEAMVKLLIDAGADVSIVNKKFGGRIAFFCAVQNNNEAMVKLLIDAGADVNTTSSGVSDAVQNNNEAMVKILIDAGANVNATSSGVSYALRNKNEAMVKLLIDAGADVKATSSGLFDAVQNNDESMVQCLIDAGADVNTTGYGGQNPLFDAVKNNNEAMVKLLIDAGADVNIIVETKFDRHRTALFLAVQNNNEAMVKLLINAGADVNIVNDDWFGRRTVLDHFVQNNNESMVRLLIDAGADVNIVGDKRNGRTVLFDTIDNNKVSLVLVLLGNGADVNFTDKHGKTPLFAAVQSNNEVMEQVLIDAGADVNVTDNEGKTVLFYAVRWSKESVVRALFHAGADVNITDNEGKTALFYAVRQRNNENVLRILIDAGADVNVTDKNGQTPLFETVSFCDSEQVVRTLIDAGADVNCTDNEGRTPLFYSVSSHINSTLAVCETFIQAGADVNTVDKTGQTALFHAVAHRNLTLTSALIDAGVDVNVKDHKKQTALFGIITDVKSLLRLGHDKTEILAQIEEGADSIPAWNDGRFSHAYVYGAHSTFNSVLQALLDAGADIDSTTIEGETAFSKAVECGDFRSVCALIKAGADLEIKIKNFFGKTALFAALAWCYRGDFRFLDELIAAGADVNTHDREGKTPLFYAVKNQSFDFTVVQRLIDAGADVNKTDNEGQTALFSLVTTTRTKKTYSDIKHIIDGLINAGLDVNKVDKYGKTVLHMAALVDNVELTHRFIEAGADAKISDWQGHTALFYTVYILTDEDVSKENATDVFMFLNEPAKTAKLNIVRALVEDGNADVNARDTLGRTPIFFTIRKSVSISTFFIENGANLSIRDNCGVTVLSLFIESCMVNNHVDTRVYPSLPCDMHKVLDQLLQHGITKNTVFEAIINVVFCKTLLVAYYVSVRYKMNEIKSLFNILKLASNYITESQNTKKKIIDNILTMVQDESRDFQKFYEFLAPDILSQLIELGANPNSADVSGNTALHFATCLPLYGLSRETVMKICHQLENFGVIFNIRNHERETPLLFCLSQLNHPVHCWEDNGVSKLRILRDVYTFLLEHGSCAQEKTSHGESVFYFLLYLVSDIFYHFCKRGAFEEEQDKDQGEKEEQEQEQIEQQEQGVQILLSFFDTKLYVDKDTINIRENFNLNSPLHLWATLNDEMNYIKVAKDTLKPLLNHLLEYGASFNIINKEGKTPLHVCSSWTAVTLLLDAGADPCVSDSLGRQPLLVATESAQRLPHFLAENRLYFDLLLKPHEFWRSAIERGLDPWTVDKRGESVLSVLIKSDQFVLAKALVEVARDDNHLQSETIATSLLNAICKDKSTRAHWKSNLAEMILKSVSGSTVHVTGHNNETSPLHHCCLNIVEHVSGYDVSAENNDKEVYWTIAKQLLLFGADRRISDSTGKSCLDIAKTNPALKDLLTKLQDIKEVPLLIPWTEISNTFKDKLAKVARHQESKHFEPYWYHKDHLAGGSFGAVYAGINEKDGREVAIKRIEKRHMQRPEDKREITNLTALADCEQVVRYLSFFEDENFSYVVLELMEGTLDDYLDGLYFDKTKGVLLCENVVSGLTYLHSQKILHRDLKPSNILYKCHPKLCLKIADFGLSRRIDSHCTTVYGTNVGTRCWIAPEVLKSIKAGEQHSKESDVFTCGLVLHYILSVKGHPFAPPDLANKSEVQINHETEDNILNGKMEGWDNSLPPEAAHLFKTMLDGDESKRTAAVKALDHPFFWKEKKKQRLLIAVGNQPEFECPRAKVTYALTAVENDLEASFGTIVKHGKWNDPGYIHMPAIYTEMMLKRKMPYDPFSTVELVRFIRNAIAHVSGSSRPTPMRKQLLEDFVFLEYFPSLVMEVYKAVTTHGWDQTREEIKYVMKE